MKQVTKRIVFTGRVQGVGFRFSAHSIARRIGLAGQVRNMADGTVEMVAQGAPEAIDQCLYDLKQTYQHGIREIIVEQIESAGEYTNFKITF